MKATLFAVAMTVSLAVWSAGSLGGAKLGQSTVSDPLNNDCPCTIYFMGRFWCVPCN